MTMQDPIADLLIRIKNAQAVNKKTVSMRTSKTKEAIARVLKEQGFIGQFEVSDGFLILVLKYYEGEPVITELKRVSRPGLRHYRGVSDIPKIKSGLGVVVVSTSQGVMTGQEAVKKHLGGEIICSVS